VYLTYTYNKVEVMELASFSVSNAYAWLHIKGTQTRGFAVEQLSSFADLLNCEVTWQNAALWLVGATAKAFADLQTQKASFSPSQLGRLEKNSTLLLLFASAVLHCQFLTFAFCTLTLRNGINFLI
jgi:hypothetical protein